MIPNNLLEQVYASDDKRHLAGTKFGEVEETTLCGQPSGKLTGRIHPCDCDECRAIAHGDS